MLYVIDVDFICLFCSTFHLDKSMLLSAFEHRQEDFGNRRFKWHVVAEYGMIEVEAEGVEGEAADGVVSIAVLDIATDGVTEILHVYADLVFATSF